MITIMSKKKKHDHHHIIPRSRGGSSSLDNLVVVSRVEHENYHTLFSNKTPVEIIEYLTRTFWKDNWTYCHEAIERYNK